MKDINMYRTPTLWWVFGVCYLIIIKSPWWSLFRSNSWGPEKLSNLPARTATWDLSSLCLQSGPCSTGPAHCSHGHLLLARVSVGPDHCVPQSAVWHVCSEPPVLGGHWYELTCIPGGNSWWACFIRMTSDGDELRICGYLKCPKVKLKGACQWNVTHSWWCYFLNITLNISLQDTFSTISDLKCNLSDLNSLKYHDFHLFPKCNTFTFHSYKWLFFENMTLKLP